MLYDMLVGGVFCSCTKSYHLDETIKQHESVSFSMWENVCKTSRERFQLFSKGILDPGSLVQLLKVDSEAIAERHL